ncbi:putative ribosomal protein L34 [Helianthus annuus]|nr:putative ribosomal protein L34 [Helianthus annuus]KAJ0758248.1 putative ribosomal protein L34 [Helianthus annuus]KAJ0761908.1 putative ribosomal protein L34 [Helianthus annuus]
MACVSSLCTTFAAQSTIPSFSLLNSARATRSSLSLKQTATSALKPSTASGLLHCSFVSSSLSLSSSSSAFSDSLNFDILCKVRVLHVIVYRRLLFLGLLTLKSQRSMQWLKNSCKLIIGSSLGLDLSSRSGLESEKRRVLVVRAGKKFQLAQTKRNKSRKSLARVHGFRLRMKTTSGRAVLKRRRAKGRWILCTKSNPSSGKRA